MPEFTKHDKHVVELYKKARVINEQKQKDFEFKLEEDAMKELDGNFWGYANGRLRMLVMSVQKAYQMKGISKAQIDEAKREVSDLLTMFQMYTDPYVINQLINEAMEKYFKDKMLREAKIA